MFDNNVTVCPSFEKGQNYDLTCNCTLCLACILQCSSCEFVHSQEDFLQKSQGVHVMFKSALAGQGQQSSSWVWILTSRSITALVCCSWLHWHCTWMEAKCQGRREDISAASSYAHRIFWKEGKGGIENYMKGCNWGFFMAERVPLRHGHWTLADLATAE